MTIWFPFSATIRQEEGFYISICPEADIICKGITIEEAIENLKKSGKIPRGRTVPGIFENYILLSLKFIAFFLKYRFF